MELDYVQLRDGVVQDRIRLAKEFLDPTDPRARSYRADIVLMLNRGLRRLVVSIDDVRAHNRELADGILFQPFDFAPTFDVALKDIVRTMPDRSVAELDDETMYYVAFSGSFGENSCNPRTLGSSLLNRMVCLEGIVTKCSLVRPKVVKSVHYNESKNSWLFRDYKDQTMSANAPASLSVYPQQDKDGAPVCYYYITCFTQLTFNAVDYRVRILYVPRPPNNQYPRDARKSTCRPAAQRCRRDHGRRYG